MAILLVGQGQQFITIQAAVNAANAGDVIVVKAGTYNESVTIANDNVRIVSEDGNAVLDGGGTLNFAFGISGDNVEVRGFAITNYTFAGIVTFLAASSRILLNRISSISGGGGIAVAFSVGALVWRNRINTTIYGIALTSLSGTSWAVENFIDRTSYGILLSLSNGHTVLRNEVNNSIVGIEIESDFHLIADNEILGSSGNAIYNSGANNVLLGNKLINNDSNGVVLDTSSSGLVEDNCIMNNTLTGILVAAGSNFNNIQDNDVINNRNNGIEVRNNAQFNFIYKNYLRGNTPYNLLLLGTNNPVLDKSCRVITDAKL